MFEIIEVIARPRVTGQLLNVLDIILLVCLNALIMCRAVSHCKDAENFLRESRSDKEDRQIIKRRMLALFFGCFCATVAGVLLAMYGHAVKPEIVAKLGGYGTALMNTVCCIITAREVYRLKNTGNEREERGK